MSTTQPAPPSMFAKDFPSWFPPTLVKELRQGLRTRVFMYFFVLTQAFMLLTLLLEISHPESSSSVLTMIWIVLGFALTALAPIRCLFSVSSEVSKNTLDLILLTRQEATKIVIGKWVANMALVFLALVSILPYLVARHFLGSGNVVFQLGMLMYLFLSSCVMCAGGVALSAVPGQAIKWLIGVALLVVTVSTLISFVAYSSMGGGLPGGIFTEIAGLSDGNSWYTIPRQLIICAILIWMFLEFGGGRIAPAGDSKSARRRILFLLSSAFCIGLGAVDGFDTPLPVIAGVILAGLGCIDALTEGAPPRRPVRNWKGLGFFLHHGWQTGAIYCFVCIVLYAPVLALVGHYSIAQDWSLGIIPITLGAQLITPAFILRIFKRNSDPHADTFQLYVMTSLILVVIMGIIAIAGEATGSTLVIVSRLVMPVTGLEDEISSLGSGSFDTSVVPVLLLRVATIVLMTGGLAFLGRRFFPRLRTHRIKATTGTDTDA